MTASDQEPLSFQTSRSFQFLYLLPILLAAALAVDLLLNARTSDWPPVILALLLAVYTVPRALARVDLDDQAFSLHMPLKKPRQVALRQLISFERSGRMGRALILRYHPMHDDGRIDIEEELFLGLPPLEQQYDLEERLQAAMSS